MTNPGFTEVTAAQIAEQVAQWVEAYLHKSVQGRQSHSLMLKLDPFVVTVEVIRHLSHDEMEEEMRAR